MCDASTEKTNGTRLRRLLLDGGTKVLRDVFDSIHPNSALPGVLKAHEKDLRKKGLYDDQIELLFPTTGQPDSKNFDITLLALLLRNICSLTAPSKGWKDEPSASDNSKEANIVRITRFRNKIQHRPGSGINDKEFEKLWKELSTPLIALGLPQEEVKNLKVKPIDESYSYEIQERFQKLCEHEQRIVNVMEDGFKGIKDELQGLRIQKPKQETKLTSCIPDEPSSFIGRQEELNEILLAKTTNEKPFVLVYGMAGIGKSTLIKKASWDLDKTKNKTVYFVDLCRCKATEEDISKTINYKLYRGTKVENEPRESLNIWARNLDRNVILVLDNAEDVVSSQPQAENNDGNSETGMSCFIKILLEIREFSSQRLNYLIASREALNFDAAINVSKKVIHLKEFEEEQSLEFINRFPESDAGSSGRTGLNENQKQEIVSLCSNIPLALHIVIPLLDDYSSEELINKLKSKPLNDILAHLKRAVSLSFDKLDDTLRDYFARLTVFSGSFNANSVMGIIKVSRHEAVEVLKKLYAKSLLQRENKKYSLHPFIHTFVVDYGMKEKQHLLEEGRLNFLNHYQSLLLENTKLYWKKDSCEESLSAFVEDRVNFEKALEISLDDAVLHPDGSIMESTKKILEELSNVVMYLESCTSWNLLGRLLDHFIEKAKGNELFSPELEALCWKGHIARRRGDEVEYERLMKQADELYSSAQSDESGVQIDERANICYKSAKGRYLAHNKNNEQAVDTFKEIIKFCEERQDDPSMNEDYARAIVELGHNLKHKKEYDEAMKMFKKASALYEKHLGKHTKTALSFKDIADEYLKQETQDDYIQAKIYYGKAIDMLVKLKSDSETHMILLLKNTGICNRKLKNYTESENHFNKALKIAENNLKADHKYKCWVNEELAYLYDDMKDREKAKFFAEEAHEMAEKLNLKPYWPTDKERLQKVLRYTEPVRCDCSVA